MMVQGQAIDIVQVPSAREFLNERLGISIPKAVKGVKSDSLKVQCLANGATEEDYKSLTAELKAMQGEHFVKSRQVVSLLVSDPSMRTSVRQSFRKKDGACIGATATFRKETSAKVSQANEIAQLRALVAKLQGLAIANA